MDLALRQAHLAKDTLEVPIGAVVYHAPTDVVVGAGHNTREANNDPMGHAEVAAISDASQALDSWRLEGCTLYVTLEPCLMCAGAIFQSRIERVVFGALDPKAGVFGSLYDFGKEDRFNHRVEASGGVRATESAELLKSFFTELRGNNNKHE